MIGGRLQLYEENGRDDMNKTIFGDCRESLRQLAAYGVRVQTCVTSPPYYGLRDYGVDGQLGLEQTPDEYIANMVEVFRCVRDVLADDGTLWLNIGDSYSSMQRSGKKESPGVGAKQEMPPIRTKIKWGKGGGTNFWWRIPTDNYGDIKPKDMIGIPWMLAFALRADGWYLRQDIIWHKPNPMPESVRDRCTKAHEYIFLLSKSERYFFDSEAMREPCSEDMQRRAAKGHTRGQGKIDASRNDAATVRPTVITADSRNRRSVWTVATRPYKGAHFATFPPALIEPCILAGSRPGDIVLDPFMGSGTTAAVAIQHGRQYIGCELNSDYAPLIDARVAAAMSDQRKMFQETENKK
jgi:DNA modification methylase